MGQEWRRYTIVGIMVQMNKRGLQGQSMMLYGAGRLTTDGVGSSDARARLV
jgi:hypothetical protein